MGAANRQQEIVTALEITKRQSPADIPPSANEEAEGIQSGTRETLSAIRREVPAVTELR